ncbi:hypothetical protein LIER_15614 [Lithospermum erythrorhizon]|uniref:Retrotransposon gag domain-containing protein n=1 Tax=Lithospermum erythrorhizon TaxID=34254 RepID=A0AAV3Q537_LITER
MAALQQQVDALSAKVAGHIQRGTNTELARLAPFAPQIRSAVVLAEMKLPVFTNLMGKTDPEEDIAEFRSQMSFHQPDSRVYYKAFPSILAGPALKWFNRLPNGCITSFEALKNRFTRAYVGRVRQAKDAP